MTQRYDTYKDSGVQWLGEIPGHWGCVPLKYFIETKSGTAINVKELDDRGTYPVYGGGSQIGFCNKYNCEETEIIVGRVGAKCGCVTFPNKKVWATDNALIIKTNLYPRFTAFVLVAADLNRLNAANAQPLITGTKIKHVRIALPPLSEQHSIVSFLDDKCGKIDEWATKKQKKVELLQELKQRVIADAVTQGLNPHVKMKATNIPWLKEIPGHWGCVFINRLFNIKAGGDVKPELYADKKDENHPFPVYTNTKSADDVYAYTSLATCPSNSITVTGRGEVGHAFFRETPYDAIVRLLSLTPKSNIICKFYAYFIDTVIPFSSDSAAIGQLSAVQIKQKHVILPPLSEQKQIVSYLDAKCSKIDKLIANITKEIERIKEYKQRLISDVVTGQIKVC